MSSLAVIITPLLCSPALFARGTRGQLTLTGEPGGACTATVTVRGYIKTHDDGWASVAATVFWDSCTGTLVPTHDEIDIGTVCADTYLRARNETLTILGMTARQCAVLLGYQWELHRSANLADVAFPARAATSAMLATATLHR